MGMTATQKILAAHCGRTAVEPGEFIMAKVDLAMGNDITAPISIEEFERLGVPVWDKDRIALVPDHYQPSKDIHSANLLKRMRVFARKHDIKYFFEVGEAGVEHTLLPQKGMVVPGDVVIGADSHTCTYGGLGAFSTGVGSTDLAAVWATGEIWLKVPEAMKFVYTGKPAPWISAKDMILEVIGRIGVEGALYMSMEHTGEAIRGLSVDSRLTLCNMAIEAGAKNGIVTADAKAVEYAKARSRKPFTVYEADADARYVSTIEVDTSKMEPVVACHPLPSNTKKVGELSSMRVDQVFIGSCTNGRIEDLRIAAYVMKGKKIHRDCRTIVIPATPEVFRQAMKEGLIEIFMEAGCAVESSNCGPCLGGHMGVLADGEKCVSTSNRNFVGRMGSPKSEAYLASPAVAAATAIKGSVAHPRDVAGDPPKEA